MRFGLVHRVMTDALAALGVLAVVSTATLAPATNVVIVVGLLLALVVPERWQSKPALSHVATGGVLLLFLVEGARIVAGQPAIDVTVEFAALLQIVRVGTRRGAAHDQQIIVLALLHFVAGTVLGGSLSFGLCFLGFLVVAPGALVLSHLRREVEGNYRQGARDRTGLPVDVPRILRSRRVIGKGFLASTCLLGAPIFVFTALLFVLFPRVGLSLLLLSHPHASRVVGFSDHVDLGDVGVLRTDPSIALRFEVPTANPPPDRITLRLRGTAFDTYDGRAWSRDATKRQQAEHAVALSDGYVIAREPRASDVRVTFDVEAIDPPVVFLPPGTAAVQLKMGTRSLTDPLVLLRGADGEYRYGGGDAHGVRYDAFVAPAAEVLSERLSSDDRRRYMTVPQALPARVAALAHSWADPQPTALLKARAIEDHLRRDYRYDLGSPSGGTAQPLDHFLFESKRGHCEFFSTAMAVMLREVGVPTRNVTGFVGGTYNRFGHYYAVRQGDAHSWVEAWIDDEPARWMTFDPTPPAAAQPLGRTSGSVVYVRDLFEAMQARWNHYVVGYDLATQARLAEGVGKRYDALRAQLGVDKGRVGELTSAPVAAAITCAALFAAYVWWTRRPRRKQTDPRSPTEHGPSPHHAAITSLYRSLEAALGKSGVVRPAAIPPLRHAEALRGAGHPLGDEVIALTHIYLGVRFGGQPLTDEAARDFALRVKTLVAPPTAK